MQDTASAERIKEAVRQSYGDIARRFVEGQTAQTGCCGPSEATVEDQPAQTGCCGPSEAIVEEQLAQASCCGPAEEPAQLSCCGPAEATAEMKQDQVSCCDSAETAGESASAATRFYAVEELTDLPDSVTDVSLGCGNPIAIAGLQPGEVVLDLGAGGGIDCFLAARKVGPEGRVIGLDMTTDMVRLARRNANKVGATNVDFRYGEMEDIPLPDESVDVIISNCVINLSPDKDAVFGEAYRVLRPGGRMTVSDVVIDGELPQSIRSKLDAWANCTAGALDESVYLGKIRAAGFEGVEVLSRRYATADQIADAEVQLAAVGPDGQAIEGEEAQALLGEAGIPPGELATRIASVNVTARKPV